MFEQVEVNSERWFNLNDLKNEIWEPIKYFEEKYDISNYGRIKSKERKIEQFNGYKVCTKTVKEKILKNCFDKDGYLVVTLNKKGKGYWKRVHQMVAQSFLEKNNIDDVVNHKDTNKQNPRLDNLEYCTNLENRKHAKANHCVRKGRKVNKLLNGTIVDSYIDAKECAKINNVGYDKVRYWLYKKVTKNGISYEYDIN